MSRNVQKKTRLTVSVTPQQKRTLERIAARSEVSLSKVVQEAVKNFIEAHPSGKLALFDSKSPLKH